MLILSMKIILKNQCLLLFILLTILHIAVQTPVNSTLQVMIISRNGTVGLCHNQGEENSKFNLTLEKGSNKEVVCLVYSSRDGFKFHSWRKEAQCQFNYFNGTFFFTVSNLDIEHTDSYTCRMDFFFPPPTKVYVTRTFIYVYETPGSDTSKMLTWILCGVASVLFLCCIVMIYFTVKRKHCRECETKSKELSKESNGEYMHMAAVPLVRPHVC